MPEVLAAHLTRDVLARPPLGVLHPREPRAEETLLGDGRADDQLQRAGAVAGATGHAGPPAAEPASAPRLR